MMEAGQATRWESVGVGLINVSSINTALGVWAPGLEGVVDNTSKRVDVLAQRVISLESRTAAAVTEHFYENNANDECAS